MMISKSQAQDKLRQIFPQGTAVSTMIVHVSVSGMTRSVAVLAPTEDPQGVDNVSRLVAAALGWPMHNTGGVQVRGAGMNMPFHLVYSLSAVLYGESTLGTSHLHCRWL